MRWIVGDVQGCARELDELLRTIRFDAANDELWSVGDLVNRGPDSAAAVRLWRDVGGRGVLGNHEQYLLQAHAGRWPRKPDTLQGLFDAPDAAELIGLLRALPVLRRLPAGTAARDVWVIHAGVHPRWTDLAAKMADFDAHHDDDDFLERDDVKFAVRVRCCTADGERSKWDREPEGCTPPHAPWDAFYRGDALVVHGHWAWRGHYRGARTIGLDSGCVYGGKLTAWCMEEDRIVQVPSAAPPARGYSRSAST
jgi:bis(5'-nucleosyl)-tetraphosphatase (symmetrical)